MNGANLRFVSVKVVVMVAEQTAEHGCSRPSETASFDAGEEPASELFAIEWCGGAVEGDVGLAIWG